jgi:outer membrane protein assembly factor BamE
MTNTIRFIRGAALYVPLLAGLGGCSNGPRIPDIPLLLKPYKIDVQQGNVVTQEMVAQLKPGMSREQVKFIMGTPLVADLFHPDRWDYVYRLQKGKTGSIEERKLTVYFEKDALVRLEGDIIPATADATLTAPLPDSGAKKVPDAQASGTLAPDKPPEEKKGFFARLWEKLGF